MKKDILFVINNLQVGGAEKALVSLLQSLDYKRYNVDLLLFSRSGMFVKQVPQEVNILPEPENYKYFDMPFKDVVKNNLVPNRWHIIYQRLRFSHLYKKAPKVSEQEQYGYPALAKILGKPSKAYDVAIGYLEKSPSYFVSELMAEKKIGYFHSDYNHLGQDANIDRKYFKNLDYVVTVSESCLDSLQQIFPEFKSKLVFLPNVLSINFIERLSSEQNPYIEDTKLKIISVGRLEAPKAFHRSIDAAAILKKKGIDFRWDILGDGSLRKDLERQIAALGLGKNFFLRGLEENPYKFIKNADIFVQGSDFEGKSIAVDEAKMLEKPIVLTNYPSAVDQITDMENGLVADLDPESLANKIILLAGDKDLQNRFKTALQNEKKSVDEEMSKFYSLINS